MQHRWKERIATSPGVLAGKPLIAGTRISVELLLDCLASGWSINEVVEAYPHISQEMCWRRWLFSPMFCGGNHISR